MTNGRDVEAVVQSIDSATASTALHCLTLDSADRMLRGEPHRVDLTEVALMIWARFTNCLCATSDSADVDSDDSSWIRLCASDAVIRLQPAACLRLFVQALQPDCRHPLASDWNPTPALRWYNACSTRFDAGACDDPTLISLLEQAAVAIETFAIGMSRVQLLAVDRRVLDSLDPHLRASFTWQLERSAQSGPANVARPRT
jgi:hypothetical protein